ncbi:MAG: RNB domain-containing ribonuclease [Desulfobacterales bacterium]|nr:RNB domain-containing ribonuclease [Desulfobacterales bacterium]
MHANNKYFQPKKKTGGVSVYFNPFEDISNNLHIDIYWSANNIERVEHLKNIKPIPYDRVSKDGANYKIDERINKKVVVYLDNQIIPWLIHGSVPYQLSLDHQIKETKLPNTFRAADLLLQQDSRIDEFKIHLRNNFSEKNPEKREIEMVKFHWELPDKAPEASQEEINHYEKVFLKSTSSENLIRKQYKDDEEFNYGYTPNNKKRYDLRDRIIYTIDGENTKDIDDAIEVIKHDETTYIIGIHIADVTEFVQKNSLRDKDSLERGTSHYLASEVIHMLPECLSKKFCSLNENEDRLAVSVYAEIKIDDQGYNLKGIRFCQSVIKSKAKLTYDFVEEILKKQKKAKDDKIQDSLLNAGEAAKIIEENSPYKRLEEIDTEKNNDKQGFSNTLIEMFMVTANRLVGEKIADIIQSTNKFPSGIGVYRVQPSPNEEDLKKYIIKLKSAEMLSSAIEYDKLKEEALMIIEKDYRLKRIEDKNLLNSIIYETIHNEIITDDPEWQLKLNVFNRYGYKPGYIKSKARLSNRFDSSYHHSLGISRYAWFTSPIRRYPDIVNHRILKSIIVKNNVVTNDIDIKKLVEKLNNQKYSQKALNRRLSFFRLSEQERLKNLNELKIKISSFEWRYDKSLLIKGIWKEKHYLQFILKNTLNPTNIIKDGLCCKLSDRILNIGDKVNIKLPNPEYDVSAEKGFIFINDESQIQAL